MESVPRSVPVAIHRYFHRASSAGYAIGAPKFEETLSKPQLFLQGKRIYFYFTIRHVGKLNALYSK